MAKAKVEYFGSMEADGAQAPFVRNSAGVAQQAGGFTKKAPAPVKRKVPVRVKTKVAPKKVIGKTYFIRKKK